MKFGTILHKDPGNQIDTPVPFTSGNFVIAPTDTIIVTHTGEDAPVDLDTDSSSISDATFVVDIPISSMSDDNSEPDKVLQDVTPINAPTALVSSQKTKL